MKAILLMLARDHAICSWRSGNGWVVDLRPWGYTVCHVTTGRQLRTMLGM